MTSQQVRKCVRTLETEHDISGKTKMMWLQSEMLTSTNAESKIYIKQAMKRIEQAMKKAKHDIFLQH